MHSPRVFSTIVAMGCFIAGHAVAQDKVTAKRVSSWPLDEGNETYTFPCNLTKVEVVMKAFPTPGKPRGITSSLA